MPTLLLIGAFGIVGYNVFASRNLANRLAAIVARGSRTRLQTGWATGTFVVYGLSAFAALMLLGRFDAIGGMPKELWPAADALGLPGWIDGTGLAILGGEFAVGVLLGVAILVIRRRRGKTPIGLRYRSPAAAQHRGEWGPAALLSLSAGVSEELFFRLLLPLLIAIVSGCALAGFLIALVAFVALHRHQGRAGMIAVGVVGIVLTALYLLTGLLWTAMLLHVVIDLNAFILRPAISGARPPAPT